ncbi:MAG: hypothetical protein WCI11_12210 [Candidatus Methylumidiphilus sp.]
MTASRVNASLNPAQLQAVRDALNNIFLHLPFLIELKTEERLAMMKFGEKIRSFVVKALAIAEQSPDILPRSFCLNEIQAHVALIDDLYPLIISFTHLRQIGKHPITTPPSDPSNPP